MPVRYQTNTTSRPAWEEGAGEIPVDALQERDIVLLVLGPPGSGKTTFISEVIGFDCGIQQGLREGTPFIRLFKCPPLDSEMYPNFPSIILIDTPGVDAGSETTLLAQVADKLQRKGHHSHLSGVLFIQHADSLQIQHTTLKNLTFLATLCCDDVSNVSSKIVNMFSYRDGDDIEGIGIRWGEDKVTTRWNYEKRGEEGRKAAWAILFSYFFFNMRPKCQRKKRRGFLG